MAGLAAARGQGEAALIGAHVATLPLKVIKQLVKHPLTDLGLAQFLADAKKIPAG